jgi:hypothetical protein
LGYIINGWNFDSILDAEIIPGIERTLCRFTNIPLERSRLISFQNNQFSISSLPLHNKTFYVPALNRKITTFTLMNYYYRDLKSFVTFPPIAVSPNDKSLSDCTN